LLSSTKRRMAVLERSIQIPITAKILMARAEERVRLTGASIEEAFQSRIPSLSTRDLECVLEEFMQLVDRPSDSLSDDSSFYVGIGPTDRASVFGVRADVSH